jgi:hypothetical protein
MLENDKVLSELKMQTKFFYQIVERLDKILKEVERK